MKYQIPHMLSAGGGTILVTSSMGANLTSAGRSVYTASKAALVGLVRSAALDYGDAGLRITAILPGTTNTALVRGSVGATDVPDAVWEVGAAAVGGVATSRDCTGWPHRRRSPRSRSVPLHRN